MGFILTTDANSPMEMVRNDAICGRGEFSTKAQCFLCEFKKSYNGGCTKIASENRSQSHTRELNQEGWGAPGFLTPCVWSEGSAFSAALREREGGWGVSAQGRDGRRMG
jgi:hypothetical protein